MFIATELCFIEIILGILLSIYIFFYGCVCHLHQMNITDSRIEDTTETSHASLGILVGKLGSN